MIVRRQQVLLEMQSMKYDKRRLTDLTAHFLELITEDRVGIDVLFVFSRKIL
jgi:hypothetical protein